MKFIVKYFCEWVTENCSRFLETYIVFLQIRVCFLNVPFELHFISTARRFARLQET